MPELNLPDLSALWPQLLSSLPAMLLIAAGAYAAHFLLCRALRLVSRHSRIPEHDIRPLVRVLDWIILGLALALMFNVLGFNLGGVWTVLSTVLAMVAIGFVAVWSVLSNTLCTVLILVARPFSIGDEIEFVGEAMKGRVTDLNFIFTTLATEDGGEIRVPNSMFFQKVLKRRAGATTGKSLAEQLHAPARS